MKRELWTEERIVAKLREVMDGLGLDRMPTFQEIKNYYHNSSLTNAISKHNGIYYYANFLGVEIKDSETTFGKIGETQVTEKLRGDGYDVTRMPQNFPYDLLVNSAVKIDVKVSKLYHGQQGSFYSFNLEKPFCTCDIYVFKTLADNGDESYYVIPSCHIFNKTQISIGENKSIYAKYRDCWQYVADYCDFMARLNE